MKYFRNNKGLLCAVLMLPAFFLYFDKKLVLWVRYYDVRGYEIYLINEYFSLFIDVISYGMTLIGIGLLLYIIGKYLNQRLFNLGRSLFIGLIIAAAAAQTLKHLIGKARPRITTAHLFVGPTFKSGYDSLPSGHATLAFFFAYILSDYFPKYRVLFYAFALLAGLNRMTGLAHFPSDVITGAVVGVFLAKLLSSKVFLRMESAHFKHPQ